MRILLIILLLLPSLLVGQLSVGVGVGVPFGGGIQATAAIITANPVNDSVNEAQNVLFSVTATGTPLTYQWQYSVDGTTYANLSNGGKYSGVTTKQLLITGVDYTYHRNYYRAIVTGGKEPPDTSTSALLYVTDSASLKYFARMTTAPTDSFKLKVNDFIISQKDSGLWDKKAVIVLLQAESAQAATLNMKGDFNNATFVNSPTFTANDGVTADVGYVNSNFIPSINAIGIMTGNSTSLTVYIKNNIANSIYDVAGGSTSILALLSRRATSYSSSTYNNDNTQSNSSVNSVPSSIGLFTISRILNDEYVVYKNAIGYNTVYTISTGITNGNIDIGRSPVNPTTYSQRKYGYYEFGSGLTAQETLENYNQLKTLLGYTP